MTLKRVFTPRRRIGPAVIGAVAVVVIGVVLGVISASFADYAIPAAAVVLLVGIAAVDLSLIPVLAIPATLIVARVGGILTVSDLVLAVASLLSLLMLRGKGGMILQPLMWAGLSYLALVVPTLILNPYSANVIEWVHEIFLVLGSMVVGFVVGREGKARLALSLYTLICCVIGIVAAVVALGDFATQGAFAPVYLGDLHKNTIGGMLAVAAVIAAARPAWLGWSRRWAYTAVALCSIGIVASQSRQGIVATVVGILIVNLRPRVRGGRRGKLFWLVAVPVVIFIIGEVNTELATGNQFNSAYQRLTWFAQSVSIWEKSPVFGVGLRWWYTNRFGVNFQPPNAEFELLTTAGIVGLFGFFAMFLAAAWLLSRIDPVYGTVGLAVIATRFTQAQFDLYWVAGQASLLWIVAGICFGVLARDRAMGVKPEEQLVRPGTARFRTVRLGTPRVR